MSGKLLTIAIPTFNRAGHLAMLLDRLRAESRGLEQWIDIVVLDNASEDTTPDVTRQFKAACPDCRIVRHATNIGSAPNFLACFEAANSKYFWMFGDDDAPAVGLLAKVVSLLSTEAPDLAYVDSRWADDIAPLIAEATVPNLRVRMLDSDAFCRRTNVYLTFISSIIVNKTCLSGHIDPKRILDDMGKCFVQLSWTLGALRHGKRFAVIEGPCVLATKGNSGGYGVMTVFGAEFPAAVSVVLGESREAQIIMRRTLICYLPGLFWEARNGTAGRFDAEDPWELVDSHLGKSRWYRFVISPIGRFSRPAALAAFTFARAVSYAVRKWDQRATA